MRIPQVLKQLILVCALSSPVSAQLQVLRQWQASPVLLQSVEFSPDGQQLLTASGGGIGQLWSLDGRPGPVLKGQRPPMFRAHFSSDGATLLTTGYDGSVRLWSTDGTLRKAFQFHRAATADARFLTQPPGYVVLMTEQSLSEMLLDKRLGPPNLSEPYVSLLLAHPAL